MSEHSDRAITVPEPGTYRIDPGRSTVRYSGKHLFGLGTVHATFAVREGEIRVAEPLGSSAVSVTVEAGSFTSGNAKRDEDVRSAKLLDVGTYPEITFVSEHLEDRGDRWVVAGLVAAHGQRQRVSVVVDRVAREDGGIRCHGRVEHLDRTALGVTGSRGMVGRHLDLELDVLAERT